MNCSWVIKGLFSEWASLSVDACWRWLIEVWSLAGGPLAGLLFSLFVFRNGLVLLFIWTLISFVCNICGTRLWLKLPALVSGLLSTVQIKIKILIKLCIESCFPWFFSGLIFPLWYSFALTSSLFSTASVSLTLMSCFFFATIN